MRFYLDEGVSAAVSGPLGAVFIGHEFTDTRAEGLTSTLDIPLFDLMRERRIDVFITLDRNQLHDPAEREAIVRSGLLMWIGISQGRGGGQTGLARQAAALLNAVAYLFDHPPEQPTAFTVKAAGREFGQIFGRRVPLLPTPPAAGTSLEPASE